MAEQSSDWTKVFTEFPLWKSIGDAVTTASTKHPLVVFLVLISLTVIIVFLIFKFKFEKMRRDDRFRHKEQIYKHRNETSALRIERMRVLLENKTKQDKVKKHSPSKPRLS